MANGNGAAVDVVLRRVDAEVIAAVETLAGEGFVELPQVDVVDAQARALEEAGDGEHGANTHFVRLAARDGEAAEDTDGLEAQLSGALCGHEQGHGRPVGQLGGVPGGHGTVLFEGRGQLGQAFDGGVGAVALVPVHNGVDDALFARLLVDLLHLDGHGDDFFSDGAASGRGGIALLAHESELVLGFPGHLIATGHHLGGVAHGHEDFRLLLHQDRVLLSLRTLLASAHGDGVHAAGHGDFRLPAGDLRGRDGDGLEARGAETVDGLGRGGHRQLGKDDAQARDVAALLTLVVRCAHDHIFDLCGVEGRVTLENRINAVREHVVGAG